MLGTAGAAVASSMSGVVLLHSKPVQVFLHTDHPLPDKLGSIPPIIKRSAHIQIFGYRVKVKIAAAPTTRRRGCSCFQRRASAGLKGPGRTKIIRTGGGETAQCDRVVATASAKYGRATAGRQRKWRRRMWRRDAPDGRATGGFAQ